MKEIGWKLLSELMKNAKLSDRKLAKRIGSSQPTVTRIRNRLEKEGYITEYTMIPDFAKLGYEILAFTLLKLRSALEPEKIANARKTAKDSLQEGPSSIIMLERGIGLGFQGIVVSIHKDYGCYTKLREWLESFDFLETSEIQSFLINLKDEIHYQPFSFSALAKQFLTPKQAEEGKRRE